MIRLTDVVCGPTGAAVRYAAMGVGVLSLLSLLPLLGPMVWWDVHPRFHAVVVLYFAMQYLAHGVLVALSCWDSRMKSLLGLIMMATRMLGALVFSFLLVVLRDPSKINLALSFGLSYLLVMGCDISFLYLNLRSRSSEVSGP